jgi:hypothetical protein
VDVIADHVYFDIRLPTLRKPRRVGQPSQW